MKSLQRLAISRTEPNVVASRVGWVVSEEPHWAVPIAGTLKLFKDRRVEPIAQCWSIFWCMLMPGFWICSSRAASTAGASALSTSAQHS